MRDPTTDLVVREITEIAIQYLCERALLETCEAIDANFAASRELLKTYVWPNDARAAEDRMLAFYARKRNRKRGRPPRHERHLQIAGAVAMLVEDYGRHPTRSHASRRHRAPSACSIVTAALEQVGEYLGDYPGEFEHLDERTVEGIWDRYRRSPQIVHRGATDYARGHRYRVNRSE